MLYLQSLIHTHTADPHYKADTAAAALSAWSLIEVDDPHCTADTAAVINHMYREVDQHHGQ